MYEQLRQISLFADFPESELQRLAETLHERHLAAGEILFQQNDEGHESYLILAGELEVLTELDRTYLRLAVRNAGELIGEMALIDQSPRSATVRAVSDSTVAVFGEEAFYAMLLNNSALAVEMLRRGTRSLRNSGQLMISGLEAKNAELARAYDELKAAQEELIFLNRIQEEMNVARRIQRQFLPDVLPQIPGWQLAALNRGAQAVGGDFFDCIKLPGDTLGLVVADACGKGVPAALFVALTRSLLRAASEAPWLLTQEGHSGMGDILTGALWFTNDYIARVHGESNMFITLFYGVLDPRTATLSYVNAGHNPPLIISPDGERIQELESFNLPLGIIETETYSTTTITLERGDMLVCFSDGITEAMNPAGEPYDDDRFQAELRAHLDLSAEALVSAIECSVDAYAAGAAQADDMTLLILKRVA
jgi:serine phosphatase RsbU (regulator of sigma subunit)